MLKQLKKKSIKCVSMLAIGLLVVTIGCLWITKMGVFALIGGGQVLDELPIDSIQGKYVTYTVDFIYDSYAYTTETSKNNPTPKTVNREYVIPVGYDENSHFMGLVAYQGSDIKNFNKLMDESFASLEGGNPPAKSYTITGTVLKMDDESRDFFYETVGFNDADSDAEYKELFLPYYLKIGYLGGEPYAFTIFLSIVSAACLLGAIFMLARALSGNYQASIKKYCKASGDEALTLERLEGWYDVAEDMGGVRMSPQWTLFNQGAYSRLLDTPSIAWAYLRTVTHRRNGVKTGTNYSLVLRTVANKKFEVPMSSQEDVATVLEFIEQSFPDIVLGYNDSWEKTYKRDAAGFVATMKAAAVQTATTNENE